MNAISAVIRNYKKKKEDWNKTHSQGEHYDLGRYQWSITCGRCVIRQTDKRVVEERGIDQQIGITSYPSFTNDDRSVQPQPSVPLQARTHQEVQVVGMSLAPRPGEECYVC